MTLIAFATYGDHAEFMTDTASYTRHVESMGRTTKHLTLNHIDAAVLTQGDSLFGDHVQGGALQVGGRVYTFDEFLESAPEWIKPIWADVVAEKARPEHIADSAVILIGWSDQHSEFVSYVLASVEDFVPRRIRSAWAVPSPWTARPGRFEMARVREALVYDKEVGRTQREPDEILDLWKAKPVLPRPASVDEWRDLGVAIRDQRAMEQMLQVIVAGELIHTRLDRGAVTSKVIHQFNDAGEEFQALIAWTRHPQAQTMACWCDSGDRFVDCHLAPELDQPCGCGSAETFRECCAVSAA